jgi:hypothetical protein
MVAAGSGSSALFLQSLRCYEKGRQLAASHGAHMDRRAFLRSQLWDQAHEPFGRQALESPLLPESAV